MPVKKEPRSKASRAKKQAMLKGQGILFATADGTLGAKKRPTLSPKKASSTSPIKASSTSPKKSKSKSPVKQTPRNQLPTPQAGSSYIPTVIPETPESDIASVTTPLPHAKSESDCGNSSSDADFRTPPEHPHEIPVKQEVFMNRLNSSVEEKLRDNSPSVKCELEESSEIRTSSDFKNDEIIVLSSDDDIVVVPPPRAPCEVVDLSSTENTPLSRLGQYRRRILDSISPEKRKRPDVEDSDTGSPKRRGTVKQETVKEECDIMTSPLQVLSKPSTPKRAALVRKAPKKASARKQSTPEITSSVMVIPESPFDSPPVFASRNKNAIESYFSSSPKVSESPLSPARDLDSDGIFTPVKARRSIQTTTQTTASLDMGSDLELSPPVKRSRPRACNKSSPDSVKSPDDDDILFDSDCPGSNSYFEGFDSETDDELKVSYDDADLKKRAEERVAAILKDVKETSASSTPRGGSGEPEDQVAAKYHAAQVKEAERKQQHQEKKEAYYKKLEEEREAKRLQQMTDASLADCETAGVEVFLSETPSFKMKPHHKLLKTIKKGRMKFSNVLPQEAIDFKFNTADVQWLLVKLARETCTNERRLLISYLKLSHIQLNKKDLKKIMKAIGLRYWDKRKGSLANKTSAYSVLNKERRTESTPCTPATSKRAARMDSDHLVTPIKARRMDSPFSPFASFDSPGFVLESPSKKAKPPQPPPPIRYRNAESLADFFDTVALLIDPDCVEFLFRLLIIVASDSSLDTQQSDSYTYAAMARLLRRRDFTVADALELAIDTVDLKSTQCRVLLSLVSGCDRNMNEFALSCASAFFLQEYHSDKTATELAQMYFADHNIIATTFFDHLVDFSIESDKSSPFIRHMFTIFSQIMDPITIKSWTPEQMRTVEVSLKSRADFAKNLDDFKFNATVMVWCTRAYTEFVVVDPSGIGAF